MTISSSNFTCFYRWIVLKSGRCTKSTQPALNKVHLPTYITDSTLCYLQPRKPKKNLRKALHSTSFFLHLQQQPVSINSYQGKGKGKGIPPSNSVIQRKVNSFFLSSHNTPAFCSAHPTDPGGPLMSTASKGSATYMGESTAFRTGGVQIKHMLQVETANFQKQKLFHHHK